MNHLYRLYRSGDGYSMDTSRELKGFDKNNLQINRLYVVNVLVGKNHKMPPK